MIAKYVSRDVLASMSAPLHELSTAHLVALEVPPVATAKFEHNLLNYAHRLLALSQLALVVVHPSLRRKTNQTLWVHKWNQLPQVRFKIYQKCSGKAGNHVPGCHLTYYVGSNRRVDLHACTSVPTLSTSPEDSLESLGGILN